MTDRLGRRWPAALIATAGAGLLAAGLAGAFGFGRHAGASVPAPATATATATATAPAGLQSRAPAHHARRPAAASDQLGGYPGAPEALSISTLGVESPIVEEVAVQARGPERGLLTAPANPLQVGWYRYRDIGALLIVGHVGDQATAGALGYIGSLVAGNSFSVTFVHATRTYRVLTVVHVRKGDLSRSLFTSADDGDVVLITCDYQSQFRDGHFADNVYVVGKPS